MWRSVEAKLKLRLVINISITNVGGKMKLRRTFIMFLLFSLIFTFVHVGLTKRSLLTKVASASSNVYPVVQVYPNFVDVGVDETFTVAVVGFNFTNVKVKPPGYTYSVWLGNLYGFEIEFTWDPTVLRYVSHNVTVPVENYPAPIPPSPYGGALHQPTIQVKNVINEAGNIPDAQYPETRAWISYASMYPAQPQNGNVTFFTITFEVLKTGESPLKILRCALSAEDGTPIYHIVQDGVYRTSGIPIADFSFWPSIGVVNKPINFTAHVSGNTSKISTYMWDFGDGKQNTTQPTVSHIYTEKGTKNVGLKVIDETGAESTWTYKEVQIVSLRDLEVKDIILPANKIKVNATTPLTFNVIIRNNGEADENCTAYAYYNTTTIEPQNPNVGKWHLIGSKSLNITKGSDKPLSFNVNTTTLAINSSYYFLINITTNIPTGYEENVENNFKISSEAIFVTNVDIHEVKIVKLECIWQSGNAKASPPLIEGEEVTALLTITNAGTGEDTVRIDVYLNGTFVSNSTVALKWGETKKDVQILKQSVSAGKYNLSVTIKAEDYKTSNNTMFKVVKPPKINFAYIPQPVVVNQTVTFDASTTIHQDPEGTIKAYRWEFYAPGLDWTSASPTSRVEGQKVTYNFTLQGNWTVVLKIEDNFGIQYDTRRPATSAYVKQMTINVAAASEEGEEGPESFPIEYLAAIIIVMIIVLTIIVAFVAYVRKRRAAKVIEELESEE
jgi:hypothetical protein